MNHGLSRAWIRRVLGAVLMSSVVGCASEAGDLEAPPWFVRSPDGSVEFFDGRVVPRVPPLLGLREQYEKRLEWLQKKHGTLPSMMRDHGVEMWIVVNHEFDNDPVTEYVAPDRRYTERRGALVFVDGGDEGLHAYADLRRPNQDVARFFRPFPAPRDQRGFQDSDAGLRAIYDTYDPATVALDMGGRRGQDSGLTRDGYRWVLSVLGAGVEGRVVPAAELVEEYFDTRLPEELEQYRLLFEVTDLLTRRALSNEVIEPGVTRAVDLKWWWEQQVADLGSGSDTWFEVHTAVQRFDSATGSMIEYVHPAPDDYVYQRGDIIHWDTGFNYMGFASDWQKVAYVLRDGEDAVPEGLQRALDNANRVHEAFRSAPRPGMSGREATQAIVGALEGVEFDYSVYSHPLGFQGHALGPSIHSSLLVAESDAWDSVLRPGSYRSIEFSATTEIPEFGGGRLTVPMEDGGYLTPTGYEYLRPYQTEWYLIR